MADTDAVTKTFTELAPRYEQTMDQELKEFWGMSYMEFIQLLIEMASIEENDVILDVATGTAHIPLNLADQVGTRGRIVDWTSRQPCSSMGERTSRPKERLRASI